MPSALHAATPLVTHNHQTVTAFDRLNLWIERQQGDLWCWAAATVSIANFFGADPRWTQCEFVEHVKGLPAGDCCNEAMVPECDQGHGFGDALDAAGHLGGPGHAPMDEAEIRHEIGATQPIAVALTMRGAPLGHGVVIRGYFEIATGMRVYVGDSDQGHVTVKLSNFPNKYRGVEWDWAASYRTQA